jgi:hypothetical protein
MEWSPLEKLGENISKEMQKNCQQKRKPDMLARWEDTVEAVVLDTAVAGVVAVGMGIGARFGVGPEDAGAGGDSSMLA